MGHRRTKGRMRQAFRFRLGERRRLLGRFNDSVKIQSKTENPHAE
jgi:hypothetical protein